MWKCHVDEFAKCGYDMILGPDILTKLVINLKISEQVIKSEDWPFNGFKITMVDLGMYIFKYLNTGKL